MIVFIANDGENVFSRVIKTKLNIFFLGKFLYII